MNIPLEFIKKSLGIDYFVTNNSIVEKTIDAKRKETLKSCAFVVMVQNEEERQLLEKIKNAVQKQQKYQVNLYEELKDFPQKKWKNYQKVLIFGSFSESIPKYWQKTYALSQLLNGPLYYKKQLWSMLQSWN